MSAVAYLGGDAPSRIAPKFFNEKSTGAVHRRHCARPSVAGTLTLKQCSRVHQNTPFVHFHSENCDIYGEEAQRDGSLRFPAGGEAPSRTHPPTHLLGACVASTVAHSALSPCLLSKILNPPLSERYLLPCIRQKNVEFSA